MASNREKIGQSLPWTTTFVLFAVEKLRQVQLSGYAHFEPSKIAYKTSVVALLQPF